MDKEPLFNRDILNHRLFSNGIEITEAKVNLFNSLQTHRKKIMLSRLVAEGIRVDPDPNIDGFFCVICDDKLASLQKVIAHNSDKHKEPNEMLRKTSCKPIIGLDLVIEYRNELNEIVEYECTLCKNFYTKLYIFWHIISFPHKELFFKSKFPDHPANQMVDRNMKMEAIDKILIEHEESQNKRENFIYHPIREGMIESSTISRLNINYIRRYFPAESNMIKQICNKEEKTLKPLRLNLDINIENPEQFLQAKEILKRMNKALIDYKW